MKIDISRVTTQCGTSLTEVLAVIDRAALGIALVVDGEGQFCGLVTDGDMRRALLNGCTTETLIDSVMRRDAVTVREGTSRGDIVGLMSNRIRHIPVLDSHRRPVDLALYSRMTHIPVAEPSLREKELEYVTECIKTNWISSIGSYVTRFEEEFSDFCGTQCGVATCNGTAALHLALETLGIGPGDEVVVPTLSFVATANAVCYTGAKPVFVDSEPQNWNMDPAQIEEAITPNCKAIIPVHLYGHPVDMNPLLAIAKKYGLFVVEDAAEAHGARYRGRRVGSMGTLGCFSFFGNKIITTGEGGMVVTDDPELAARARMLRDHGMSTERKYWHPRIGFNYRLTNIQAAIGVAQLERIQSIVEQKRKNALLYTQSLQGMKEIICPTEQPWAYSVFWMYTVMLKNATGVQRDSIIEDLKREGVSTRPVFIPIHHMPPYQDNQSEFRVADQVSRTGISLPSSVSLSPKDIARISDSLSRIIRSHSRRTPVIDSHDPVVRSHQQEVSEFSAM